MFPEPAAQFVLGDVALQSGTLLPDARLAYRTIGRLNGARSNAIVMPTYFTGTSSSYLPLIHPGRALDPEKYFIVIPALLGNGESTSPSNAGANTAGAAFPLVTLHDNVRQQARLVFDHLGVRGIALVCGWSMGGMQTYEWAVQFPDVVERILPYCAAARTGDYNQVFLDGLAAVLDADVEFRDGIGRVPYWGLRAFGRVYAGWAYSEQFFRDGLYVELGFKTLEALLKYWEDDHVGIAAQDLMAMLRSWQHADVSENDRFLGNLDQALASIQARTLLLSVSTDRYFAVADNEYEAGVIPDCELRVLDSPFGHCALSPGKCPRESEQLERALSDLLQH